MHHARIGQMHPILAREGDQVTALGNVQDRGGQAERPRDSGVVHVGEVHEMQKFTTWEILHR